MRRVESLMGTTISLELAGAVPMAKARSAADGVFAWLREVDDRFSTFKADSEVSRFAGDLGVASTWLREVLERCAELWTETEGYFDAYATGRLDPSGFVKGWAVQVASDRLMTIGLTDHCLNAGGDVRVRGESSPGQPWRIGIRHPWQADRTCCVVAGTDLGVATSGVYERGPHVVDPFTSKPARGLRSVTVAGPDLGVADAYATAAVAMGAAGTAWLATLVGYESAVVSDDAHFYCSDGLPVVPD